MARQASLYSGGRVSGFVKAGAAADIHALLPAQEFVCRRRPGPEHLRVARRGYGDTCGL